MRRWQIRPRSMARCMATVRVWVTHSSLRDMRVCREVRRAGPLASSVQVTLRRVCSCRAGGCVLTTRAWDAGIYTADNPYGFTAYGGEHARPCPPCSTSCLQGVPTPRGTGGVVGHSEPASGLDFSSLCLSLSAEVEAVSGRQTLGSCARCCVAERSASPRRWRTLPTTR